MSSPHDRLGSYRRASFDSAQQFSSQKQLVMLLRGMMERLHRAAHLLQAGDIPGKAQQISSALPILEVLQASLDPQANGPLAERLSQIYDTASIWLAEANARNDAAKLRQTIDLLQPVADAFAALPEQAAGG